MASDNINSMSAILSNDCHGHLFFFGEKPDGKRTIMIISRIDGTKEGFDESFLAVAKRTGVVI